MAQGAWSQSSSDQLANAREYASTGRLANAENALHSYIADNPSSAEAYFLLGYVLFREQRAKDSLAAFTEGAKYQRPGAGEFKIVASDYVLLGAYSDADKWFSQVITQNPDDAETWYLLGRTKYNENDFSAAATSFERSLQLRPMHIEAENNLGLCWKELGQLDKAKAAFQLAIEWQGATPADAQPYLNLGTLLSENTDEPAMRQSLTYLAEAESLSPDNPKVHETLADAYSSLKNLPQAQRELEKAIELAPGTSALHYKLGQIYRKQGMREQAQQQFAICEKLSSAHSSNKTPNPLEPDHPNSK
ncbi:tetratricopeptide repeat protein [Acidicapsa dinghuensis]|uniref:Tetratricopeptide repeat protein n=1 Tax=Acidicapsa dinghuensis TaxID=2218256 RepID=A0ABW1EE98_9BACT|nr:tetratricopeptide repeat protein [Acidicapsa dinghuensis]